MIRLNKRLLSWARITVNRVAVVTKQPSEQGFAPVLYRRRGVGLRIGAVEVIVLARDTHLNKQIRLFRTCEGDDSPLSSEWLDPGFSWYPVPRIADLQNSPNGDECEKVVRDPL